MSNYNPSRPFFKRPRAREDEGRSASRPVRRSNEPPVQQRLETALRREAEASAELAEVVDEIREIKAWLTTFGIEDFGPDSASLDLTVVRDNCLGEVERQAQVQRDAEAARAVEAERVRAEEAAANATEVANAEQQLTQEQDRMLDVGDENPDQQAVSEEKAETNEEGIAPNSAVEADQAEEVTTSVKDILLSGPVMPPQVTTPASGEPAKDTTVSGPVAPEQRIEPSQASAQVRDASASGSAAPAQKAPPAKVAVPLARPPQAQGKPVASGQPARPVLPAVSRRQKPKGERCCEAYFIHSNCRAQPGTCGESHVLLEGFPHAQIFKNAFAANNLPRHTLDAYDELLGRQKRQRDQAGNRRDNGPDVKIGSGSRFSKQGQK